MPITTEPAPVRLAIVAGALTPATFNRAPDWTAILEFSVPVPERVKVPLEIVVVEQEFVPVKVNIPLLCLMIFPVPLMFPAKVWSVASPIVNVAVPRLTEELATPVKLPMVWLKLCKSRMVVAVVK